MNTNDTSGILPERPASLTSLSAARTGYPIRRFVLSVLIATTSAIRVDAANSPILLDPFNFPTILDPDHLGECGFWETTECEGKKWHSSPSEDCPVIGTPDTINPDGKNTGNNTGGGSPCPSCGGGGGSYGSDGFDYDQGLVGVGGFPIAPPLSPVIEQFGAPTNESQLDQILTVSLGATPQGTPLSVVAVNLNDYFTTGSLDMTMVSRLLTRAGMSSWSSVTMTDGVTTSGAPCRLYFAPSGTVMVVDYTASQFSPIRMEVHTFSVAPPHYQSSSGTFSDPNTSGPEGVWTNYSDTHLTITPVGAKIKVEGTFLGHVYDTTFEHEASMSPYPRPANTIVTTTEVGRKKVVSTVYEDASDDLDGWRRTRQVDIYKPGVATNSWTLVSTETDVYLTNTAGRELLIEHTDAKGVTHYSYDEVAVLLDMINPSFGRKTSFVRSDGYWEKYEYDLSGNLWRIYRPWQGNPATPEEATPTNCKLTVINNFDDLSETDYEVNQNSSIFINGILTEQNFAQKVSNGVESVLVQTDLRHRMGASGAIEPYYVTRERHYDIAADGATMLRMTVDEQGIRKAYRGGVVGKLGSNGLFVEDATGTLTAYITAGPLAEDGTTIPQKTSSHFAIKNAYRQHVLDYDLIATDSASMDLATYATVGGTRYFYDAQKRLMKRTTLTGAVLETTVYDDVNHSRTVTDANGLTTIYTEDTLGRTIGSTRMGVTADPTHGIPYDVPAVTEATAYTSNADETVYSETTVREGGALQQITSVVKDTAGRVTAKVDEQGRMTTYAYTDTSVVSYGPGGNIQSMKVRFSDGQTLVERDVRTGEIYYSRGVNNDGSTYESGYETHNESLNYSVTGAGGTLITSYDGARSSNYYHLENGRVWRVVRGGMADLLREYDALGAVIATGTDMDNNQALDRAGADTLTETATTYQQADGTWWVVTTESRYVSDGSDTDKMVRQVWRKIDHSTGSTTKTIESDGRIVWDVTTIDRAHAVTTVRHSVMRGTQESEVSTQNYVAGLLVSETQPGISGSITHEYDALRRRIKTVHPVNGTSQWFYAANGQLLSTVDSAGKTTSYTYYPATHINAGLTQTATYADGSTTSYEYDAAGRVTLQAGSNGYRTAKTYTVSGRPATLKTWRVYENENSPADTTTWTYQPYSGRLLSKTDSAGQSTSYTYDAAGQVATRTWARNVTATYSYDGDGRLTGTVYSDSTPAVSILVDRLGRQKQITDASGTRTLGYDCPCPTASATEYDAGALLSGLSVVFGHDAYNRRTGLAIDQGGTVLAQTDYTYTTDSNRLSTVSLDGVTATYDWSTQVGALPGDVSYTGSGLHGHRSPDAADRLDTIAWSIANQTVSSTDYELDVMGRRSKASRDDGTHWDYGYNTKGEVTSAVQKAGDDSALPGRDFGYNYDGIGNRTSATVANVYPPPPLSETNYTANNLNQYTGIEHPSPLRKVLQGLAHENAAIEVRSYNSQAEAPAFNATSAALAARPASLPVARIAPNGQGFITEAPAANNSGPTWRYLTIDAARPGVGMNGRTVKTQRTGWLYYPPANETLVYDLDGNLTEDARWTYTWDAENRLTQMTEKDDGSAAAGTRPALQRLSFTYDSQSRRIRKVVESLRDSSNWSVTSDTRFLYDDWNLVGEFAVNQQSGIMNLKSSYAWGLDLSGTQQGAGGVGGLLLVKTYPASGIQTPASALAPTYDGNGNITAYVELASGNVVQRLEYDAFGNELSLESSLVQTSSFSLQTSGAPAFGFSSKYTDHESGLCYYGFRYYSPELGRWTARDPIGERGGLNLSNFVGNGSPNNVDHLGQCCANSITGPITALMKDVDWSHPFEGVMEYAERKERENMPSGHGAHGGGFAHCVANCMNARVVGCGTANLFMQVWNYLFENPNSPTGDTSDPSSPGDIIANQAGLDASGGSDSCVNECKKKYPPQ